jgi:hypothetical protein
MTETRVVVLVGRRERSDRPHDVVTCQRDTAESHGRGHTLFRSAPVPRDGVPSLPSRPHCRSPRGLDSPLRGCCCRSREGPIAARPLSFVEGVGHGPVAPAGEDRTSTDHGLPCGARAEGDALHSWLFRLWKAVDARDELFAICVSFERLCVDKPSKRLASMRHSVRTVQHLSPLGGSRQRHCRR